MVDYGYDYFGSRVDELGMIPFVEDYEVAEALLGKLDDLRLTVSTQDDLLHLARSLSFPSRTLKALPESLSGRSISKRRSLDDLQQHGVCADLLRPGPSTVYQAGRGAFLTRAVTAGGVVAPMPLIHIPDRKVLHMFDDGRLDDDGTLVHHVVHEQLLLNYCWGHADTTLLLCPYGVSTSLINHSSEPNVRLEWNEALSLRKEWFEQPLGEWAHSDTAGLVWNVVALRDMEAGEEVLLDYGEEWERAWEEHVRNWTPMRDEDYRPAYEWDTDLETPIPSRLLGVTTLCRVLVLEYLMGLPIESPDDEEHDYVNCRIMDRIPLGDEWLYTVMYSWQVADDSLCWEDDERIAWQVPRDGLCFEDERRDHVELWAFRHEARLPEDLLPLAWRNAVVE